MPNRDLLENKAENFAGIVKEEVERLGADQVMIGSGMPSHQPYITYFLEQFDLEYCYSFSKRECIEEHQADGSVKKTFTFIHEGFYRA